MTHYQIYTYKQEIRGRLTTHQHQLLRQPQLPVRPHHAQARDVPVRHAVRRLLLHLGEHISDDLWRVCSGAGRAGVDRHVGERRPGQGVVQVVLEEVVLGEVGEVGLLDMRQVRGAKEADVHVYESVGL